MKNYSLIVIGAGAGGLVVAVGAAKAGKKVLLIENGNYGGDCTNAGCIPSKSLIASAHAAYALKEAYHLGIELSSFSMQTQETLNRTRRIIEEVRTQENAEALQKIGVETITGLAAFTDSYHLEVNQEKIFGKQIVIATGSTPLIPPILGLENTPYLTNETLFQLQELPESLAIIGGGPIGCEMAQTFHRLGAKVFLLHSHRELLNKEEPQAQEAIAKQFKQEGIALHLGKKPQEVRYQQKRFHIVLDAETVIESQALLIAVGRQPNFASLNLTAAGVEHSEKGIAVDAFGRTNKEHIWAIGDVIGAPFFTHWAESQARSVLTSLLLPFKKKLELTQAIPRVTYTDPEVASAGLLEKEAEKRYRIATYVVPFSSVDRALTTGRTEGLIKIVTKKWSSQILGCTIVGPRAGEMLGELTLAMLAKIPLRKLSRLIHPYPTYNQAIRKAADLWLTQTILPLFKRKKN